MKKILLISVLISIVTGYCFLSCRLKTIPREKALAQQLSIQTDSFKFFCNQLQLALSAHTTQAELQQLFLQARMAYKKIEWAAEYFVPATSRFVNGPPVDEIETSGQVFKAAGLQVIEALLYPGYNTSKKTELIKQLQTIQSACNKYQTYFNSIDIFDWQVFDAAKLELFRIETLGITGFDNPLTLKSMVESATALQSVQHVIEKYKEENTLSPVSESFAKAIQYLCNHTDFNSFNRAEFITAYCNPLTTNITTLKENLKIHVIKYNRLLNQEAKTLFDTNAFNVNAYAPDESSFISNTKTTLGKLLFADPILSGTGTRSCQSCHQPGKAFTDGLLKNTTIGNRTLLPRNTPTLINTALQPSQFYDLRVNTLEDQSRNVMQNILEMHGSMKVSVEKLWRNETYRQMFSAAFPKRNRTYIDTLEIMNAIGSYIRSLTNLNSRFDEYMRGDVSAMNTAEVNGFNLFTGKAKCATCHYMPLFNGTFPPRYMKIESEVIGVPQSTLNKKIDDDQGRFNAIPNESFRHAFKIPTLRNAALTAPYMHNGVFGTLEEVIDFYNKGGGEGLGLAIPNQTLPPDKLKLNKTEVDNIIAFIKSLNSINKVTGR